MIEYLAAPYSHKSRVVRSHRVYLIDRVTAFLIKHQRNIYSPITHCHRITEFYGLPTGFVFWKDRDYAFIEASKRFLILKLPGWTYSKGIQEEKNYAMFLKMEIELINPLTVGITKEMISCNLSLLKEYEN